MDDSAKQKIEEMQNKVADVAKKTTENAKDVLDQAKEDTYDLVNKGRHRLKK